MLSNTHAQHNAQTPTQDTLGVQSIVWYSCRFFDNYYLYYCNIVLHRID